MKILVLPDFQVKPDTDLSYIGCIGRYICDKRPDVIVHLGDFADMPSLSSYDVGKKSFEGRRYTKDVEACLDGLDLLFTPIWTLQMKQRAQAKKLYTPRSIITLGNHENRISRAVNNDPKLEGLISVDDLMFKDYFDEVHPFLDVVVVEGVAFSHYFTSGVMGRPTTSAASQLSKKHQSCVAGHQQGLQISMAQRADGKRLTSVIAGSCYQHDEEYLGKQGNEHWRGCLMLHSVNDGEFDLVPVPLKYLEEKYG